MPSKEVLESLQSLHRELNKLEPAIRHVETAVEVTNTVKGIPDKHNELIGKLEKADEAIRKKLGEDFKKHVDEIKKENTDVVRELKDLKDEIEGYHEKLEALRKQIESYYEKIGSINFPERLDKLDNTISGINIGIQNLQAGMRDLDKKVTSSILDLRSAQKRGNTLSIILVILVALSLIIGGYMVLKM